MMLESLFPLKVCARGGIYPDINERQEKAVREELCPIAKDTAK